MQLNIKLGKVVSPRKKLSRFTCLRRRGSSTQNRLRYKTFADGVMFYVNISQCNDDGIFSCICALLMKQFYENNGNDSVAVHEFSHMKNIWCGAMSIRGIRDIIKGFEETG